MKNKVLQNKLEDKMSQLEKNNESMRESVDKVEGFSKILDGVKE